MYNLEENPVCGMRKRKTHEKICSPAFVPALLLSLTYRLEEIPPFSFGEGWVMSVARNWVELGRYVSLFDGRPIPPSMLNIGFPAVAPIAFSFCLFGVGIWQGRLPGVLFTIGALCLLYHLALRLYDRKVALGTLFVVVFMSGKLELHPFFMGRYAGERCLRCSCCWPAMISFCLVAMSSSPPPPRRLVLGTGRSDQDAGAALPCGRPCSPHYWGLPVNGCERLSQSLRAFADSWRVSGSSGGFRRACCRPICSLELPRLLLTITPPRFPFSSSGDALLLQQRRLLAPEPNPAVKEPPLIGTQHTSYHHAAPFFSCSLDCGSVTAARSARPYLFVPVFVGSIFVAVMLCDLTSGFSIPATVKSAADTILRLRFNRSNIFSMVVVLLFALVPITAINIFFGYASPDRSSREVAEFLNTSTPPDALIETYDMEIFVLLDRRYSHPPDDVHLRVRRHNLLGP